MIFLASIYLPTTYPSTYLIFLPIHLLLYYLNVFTLENRILWEDSILIPKDLKYFYPNVDQEL